jgi:hypothetical protein
MKDPRDRYARFGTTLPLGERPVWVPGEPLVVCAALRDTLGRIVTGARHFDQIMHEQINRCVKREYWKTAEQGFIDQKGNFLTREEAHKIAWARGQIRRRCGGDDKELFSDNLY